MRLPLSSRKSANLDQAIQLFKDLAYSLFVASLLLYVGVNLIAMAVQR